MAHTLLCGQRRYTLPTVVIPTAAFTEGNTGAITIDVPLKVTNIKPPGGIVISAARDSAGARMLFEFFTEQGSVILLAPDEPTLFVSDSTIQKILFGSANPEGFVTWWIVQDVAYLAEVKDGYGR